MKTFIEKSFQRVALLILLFIGIQSFSQPYPNPYRLVENWANLPDGRIMEAVGKVTPAGARLYLVFLLHPTTAVPESIGVH